LDHLSQIGTVGTAVFALRLLFFHFIAIPDQSSVSV